MLPWGSGYKLLQTGSLEVPRKFRNAPCLKSFLYPQGAYFAYAYFDCRIQFILFILCLLNPWLILANTLFNIQLHSDIGLSSMLRVVLLRWQDFRETDW